MKSSASKHFFKHGGPKDINVPVVDTITFVISNPERYISVHAAKSRSVKSNTLYTTLLSGELQNQAANCA